MMKGNEKETKQLSIVEFLNTSSSQSPSGSPKTQWMLVNALQNNVQTSDFMQLSELAFELGLTKKEYAGYLHINTRTLDRNLKEKFTLDIDKSEKVFRLYEMMKRGIETIGTKDKFSKWIREENTAMQQKPISLFSTIAGIEIINNILTRIEYGVFS